MSPYEAQIILTGIAVQAHIPVLTVGKPGIAKTSVTYGISRSLDAHLEVIISAFRDPTDFGGLPVIEAQGVALKAPQWAYRLTDQHLAKALGVLYLDEINQAAPATQAALMRVVLERHVGEIRLSDRVSVIASMNPLEMAAGAHLMQAPLANRFLWIQWVHDHRAWINGLMDGFPDPMIPRLPQNWRDFILGQRAGIASFINARPDLLVVMPKDDSAANGPFPTLRTWTMAADLLAACQSVSAPVEVQRMAVEGLVGPGAMIELFQFRDHLDLPDPEQVLTSNKLDLPKDGDKQYAVLMALAAAVRGKNTVERWEKAAGLIAGATKTCPDIAASAMRVLLRDMPNGAKFHPGIKAFKPLMQAAGIVY